MTQRIQLLPENVINQIAAGEVIERPASVVKELVENALDAGATEVRIQIEAGGKNLIRIWDNGSGMSEKDLFQCPLRHATSKLRSTEDLLRIATNGFRGEAVASIASISHLEIETCPDESGLGHSIQISGGDYSPLKKVARPQGTTFSVRELFYNTPVRRTFLGSDTLETSRIVDVMTRIALAHPEKRFEVKQGGRELLNSSPGTLTSRISDLLGTGIARQMIPFEHNEAGIRVSGFTSKPEEMRGKRTMQYFYIKERPIHNSLIAKAVARAYEPYSKVGYPVVVLFIDMEGSRFDVNVHPSKREVRFSNENDVYLAVHHALRQAMLGEESTPIVSLASFSPVTVMEEVSPSTPEVSQTTSFAPISVSTPSSFQTLQSPAPAPFKQSPPREPETQDLFSLPEYGKIVPLSPKLFQKPQESQPSLKGNFSVRYLQWSKTYIVCEDSQGLLLIDQNAASQRILFETALHALESGKGVESQELLFPELIDLSKSEAILLTDHISSLEKLGYHIESFGGGSWQLRGIPVLLPIGRAENALRQFLASMGQIGNHSLGPQSMIAKSFAEGTAIPAGMVLNAEEMAAILEQLVQTSDPYTAPSGRPALLRLPIDEMHRRFGRSASNGEAP